ncbi:MAG: DnaJ domain-containing protein [Chloroflexi bacterium]|nr:DnaJ domain-containing protein [Chloroflexota bacterium]
MPDPQIDTRPWHRARVFLETREILPDFPERFARAWAEWQRVGKPAVLIGRWDPTVLSQAPDDPPRSRTGPRPGAGSTGPRPGAGSTGSRPGTGSAGSRTGTGSTGPRSQYQAPPRPAPEPGDHYALLGVPPTATAEEVRRAYRRLARKYHPDTTTEPRDRAAERFKRITEAYEVLSDPKRRAEYDRRRNKA